MNTDPKTDFRDRPFPLLATKLYIPQRRQGVVRRTHLIESLNKGINRKLTLISAAAGFGKTTLLSEWISQGAMPVAWISLDKSDNNPVQFAHYLVAALRTVHPNIGENALTQLQSSQRPPVESILTFLIKELTALPEDLVLVFDDYHAIDTETVHSLVRTLLDYLPDRIHIVITTRVDPPLPLARLRVGNRLSELRTIDLCFSADETTAFFNGIMKLRLSSDDISVLETRTEGWIAGLQLAAISLRSRADVASFITEFAGDDRHVVDYLVEEVLDLQPEPIQKFLLQTSILNRLSEPLCDFVTGKQGSQKILDELEKSNLFTMPLDDKRHWYRYHHLFADLLRQRLHRWDDARVDELHARASRWYQKNRIKGEAVQHAFNAHDLERAAVLIREYVSRSWEYSNLMVEWHKMLPLDVVHNDPELSVFNALMLHEAGRYDAAEENLAIAERLTNPQSGKGGSASAEPTVHAVDNPAEFQGKIATLRSYVAINRNKVRDAIRFSKAALAGLPSGESDWRPMASIALGQAHFASRALAEAHAQFKTATEESRRAGNFLAYLIASLRLAAVMRYQGRLPGALAIFVELLETARKKGWHQLPMMGMLYNSWGEVLGDLNQPNEAISRIRQGLKFGEMENNAATIGWSYLRWARVLFVKNDIEGAEAIVRKMAEKSRTADFPRHIADPLENLTVRIWLRKGRIEPAVQWMREQEAKEDDETTLLRESKRIVFARILLAEGEPEEALERLRRLVKTAEEDRRIIEVIEMLLIQATILKSRSDWPATVAALKKAVSLAEPGGLIGAFVEEGPPISELLCMALDRDTTLPRAYVKKLLQAFRLTKLIKTDDGIVERLSERELEILRLVAAGLPNKTITQELYISMSTVKTHLRNIFGKLGVNSRIQAAAKAKELDLL
ncbi:MAG: helix-turn-helix transcriptional regulator [Proteobacteria bacterium]|nr:helix-turn-helix transcriptional regulator [Pseudomonadota bacterium]